MKAAIITYTVKGVKKALELKECCDDEFDIFAHEKTAEFFNGNSFETFQTTSVLIKNIFDKYDGIIFIGAASIAVRSIAPYIKSKYKDPAVLVMDDNAIHVISLLSGHAGGANEWCKKIAAMPEADAVITTATDVNGDFAADIFAIKNNLKILNPYLVKDISTRIVNGECLGIYTDDDRYNDIVKNECEKYSKNIKQTSFKDADIVIVKKSIKSDKKLILMVCDIVVGIGCRRETKYQIIKNAIDKKLADAGYSFENVKIVASIDKKADETGIIQLVKDIGADFVTYTAQQLMEVPGDFASSDIVYNHVGADNVCQRSACRASCYGECILPKTIENGMTVSIYRLKNREGKC